MAYQSSWSEILAFRLRRHHLYGTEPDQADPVTLCRDVCGMQAQLQSAAELSIGVRNHRLSSRQIRRELWEKHTLVKTSCMRQTLHLIPAEDYPVYIAALKESRSEALLGIMARFGLGRKEYDRLCRTVEEAVGRDPVPRQLITKQIKKSAGKNLEEYIEKAWEIQLYRPALVEGLICCGPRKGNLVTYMRSDQWLSGGREMSPKSAKQELLMGYLKAYGPAGPADFSKWSGMPMREVKEVWESALNRLAEIRVGDEQLYLPEEDMDPFSGSSFEGTEINLLPRFDTYLLGHAGTDHLVSPENYKKVYRNQGWISPAVLLNGRITGVWNYEETGSKDRCIVTIEPFEPLSRDLQKEVAREAEKLGSFLDASFELEYA